MNFKNYHTHTFRCGHATGDAIDYAEAAYAQGAMVLGISDHAALPDNRWLDVRMSFDELDDYEQSIHYAQQQLPQMKILKGMECEYVPEFHSYYEDELLGKRGFDYLIGAAHYIRLNGEWVSAFEDLNNSAALAAYAAYLTQMMETRLFAFVAHPDLLGNSNDAWNKELEACTKDILQVAQETQTPLEINGSGFRKAPKFTSQGTRAPYPWRPFWEMVAGYEIPVIINSDAHSPQEVLSSFDDALKLAEGLNLNFTDLAHLE